MNHAITCVMKSCKASLLVSSFIYSKIQRINDTSDDAVSKKVVLIPQTTRNTYPTAVTSSPPRGSAPEETEAFHQRESDNNLMMKPLHPSYEPETSRSTMNNHRHILSLLENIYGSTKTTRNLKPPTIDSSPPRRDVGDRDREAGKTTEALFRDPRDPAAQGLRPPHPRVISRRQQSCRSLSVPEPEEPKHNIGRETISRPTVKHRTNTAGPISFPKIFCRERLENCLSPKERNA
ncbi:hypothetical protein Bca4012_092984 [Brassica carinata]